VSCVCTSLSIAQSNRVALLTEISGTVELARSGTGSFEKADWGTPLFAGDRLRTAASSQAVVLFSNNNMMTISAGNTFTITAGDNTAASSQSVSDSIVSSDSDLTLHRAGQGEIEVLGGLRNSGSSDDVTLDSPINTAVGTTHPEFRWSAKDDFELYRVTIQSESGVVWTHETESRSVLYPESAPALAAGKTYFWSVEGENILDVSESVMTSFEILTDEEQQALNSGLSSLNDMYSESFRESSYYYLLGSLYAKHNVLGPAIKAFEWIAKNNPDSPSAHRVLGNLYVETGQKDAAIASLQRAVDLTQEN